MVDTSLEIMQGDNDPAPIKPKRGRRSKKAIEEAKKLEESKKLAESNNELPVFSAPETLEKSTENMKIPIDSIGSVINDDNKIILCDSSNVSEKPPGKKRGRKPKGGKIVAQTTENMDKEQEKPNVILHLKCQITDLFNNCENSMIQNNIDVFHHNGGKLDLNYKVLNDNGVDENIYNPSAFINTTNTTHINIIPSLNVYSEENTLIKTTHSCANENEDNTKELLKKLKDLEYNLHTNNISDKKSACFWCTYDFDNPPIFIPKFYLRDSYHVYGCFCTPECATAYLMEENIDSSVKFERYHLLNHIYSKIYEYKKNIKPAPNPHYMLERYYGSLSIQEYRALMRSERLFLIVDKPLTRVMPELHEDNDDFIINNKIIPQSNNLRMKRKVQKKVPQTKTNIVNENFGLTTN